MLPIPFYPFNLFRLSFVISKMVDFQKNESEMCGDDFRTNRKKKKEIRLCCQSTEQRKTQK